MQALRLLVAFTQYTVCGFCVLVSSKPLQYISVGDHPGHPGSLASELQLGLTVPTALENIFDNDD